VSYDPPVDYVAPSPDDFAGWRPWYPDGYPITDEFHNPWLVIDPISGRTAFGLWNEDRTISEDDFRSKLNELTQGNREWNSQSQRRESLPGGSDSAARSAAGSYIAHLVARGLVDGAKASSSSHDSLVQGGRDTGRKVDSATGSQRAGHVDSDGSLRVAREDFRKHHIRFGALRTEHARSDSKRG
jgi:hypothetical protein